MSCDCLKRAATSVDVDVSHRKNVDHLDQSYLCCSFESENDHDQANMVFVHASVIMPLTTQEDGRLINVRFAMFHLVTTQRRTLILLQKRFVYTVPLRSRRFSFLVVDFVWFCQVGKLLMENAQLALQSDTMKSRAAAIRSRSVFKRGNYQERSLLGRLIVELWATAMEKYGMFHVFVLFFWTFRTFPRAGLHPGQCTA